MARYILYRMTCRIADTSRRLPRYESLNRNLLQGKRIAVNSAIFPITGSFKIARVLVRFDHVASGIVNGT